MNPDVLNVLKKEALSQGISLSSSFSAEIDEYIARYYSGYVPKDKIIIETYLSDAALRIAKTERKTVLEAAHGKAAVWLFHQPDQVNSTCAEAGAYALKQESERSRVAKQYYATASMKKGVLNEAFARHLDSK